MIIYEESNEELESSSIMVNKIYPKDAFGSFSEADEKCKDLTTDGDELPTNAMGTKANSQEKIQDYGLELSEDSTCMKTRRETEGNNLLVDVQPPELGQSTNWCGSYWKSLLIGFVPCIPNRKR